MNMHAGLPAAEAFRRKPIVVVEDHGYHLQEVVGALAAGPLAAQTTLVCLDRPGPDTATEVARWLARLPGLQVAALAEGGLPDALPEADRARFIPLAPEVFRNRGRFCKTVASLLRPGGLLVQDIQLETLRFIDEEEWWETIYLAGTVRGILAHDPPGCGFMSNKSGFGISFGRELMEAGFDPRDVIDKNELTELLGDVLHGYMAQRFPLVLASVHGEAEPEDVRVGPRDRASVAAAWDLVLWHDGAQPRLTGRLLRAKSGKDRPEVKLKEAEAATWEALIRDRLDAGAGVDIDTLGARLAPEGALRPERSNVAARHLHGLRARLDDPDAVRTIDGTYRLQSRLHVGIVHPMKAN